MFSSNKPFHTFNRPQKPFGLVGVDCVLNILLMRNNFQIFQSIVGTIQVFVVYFQTPRYWPIKRFPYHSVRLFFCVFSFTAKIHSHVMCSVQSRLDRPVRLIPRPSFTQLDRMGCGYAGAQKLSNLLKGGSVFKHLLGLGNFGGVKGFTSGDAAHISNVAYFVQVFKVQNWFPRFHSHTPFNMNRSIA